MDYRVHFHNACNSSHTHWTLTHCPEKKEMVVDFIEHMTLQLNDEGLGTGSRLFQLANYFKEVSFLLKEKGRNHLLKDAKLLKTIDEHDDRDLSENILKNFRKFYGYFIFLLNKEKPKSGDIRRMQSLYDAFLELGVKQLLSDEQCHSLFLALDTHHSENLDQTQFEFACKGWAVNFPIFLFLEHTSSDDSFVRFIKCTKEFDRRTLEHALKMMRKNCLDVIDDYPTKLGKLEFSALESGLRMFADTFQMDKLQEKINNMVEYRCVACALEKWRGREPCSSSEETLYLEKNLSYSPPFLSTPFSETDQSGSESDSSRDHSSHCGDWYEAESAATSCTGSDEEVDILNSSDHEASEEGEEIVPQLNEFETASLYSSEEDVPSDSTSSPFIIAEVPEGDDSSEEHILYPSNITEK